MYYQKIALAITACAVVAAFSESASSFAANFTNETREHVQHTFNNDNTLDVDNFSGSIDVIGDGGATIRMEGEKIVRADSKDELERAKREVTLDTNEKNGVAQLYVNGPFRGGSRRESNGTDPHGFHEHNSDTDRWDSHYEVTYNLTVHVPRQTELRLRGVNGTIRAEQTTGKFDVRGVNGTVTMSSIGGSGSVRAVNGALTLSFNSSPTAPCDFTTVNGRIDATFPASLHADLLLKTMNGSAFTDFDGTAQARPVAAEKRDRMSIYRPKGSTRLQVGGGGPELSFKTVNGDILIHKGTSK